MWEFLVFLAFAYLCNKLDSAEKKIKQLQNEKAYPGLFTRVEPE